MYPQMLSKKERNCFCSNGGIAGVSDIEFLVIVDYSEKNMPD
jgi:hypothetical protein